MTTSDMVGIALAKDHARYCCKPKILKTHSAKF